MIQSHNLMLGRRFLAVFALLLPLGSSAQPDLGKILDQINRAGNREAQQNAREAERARREADRNARRQNTPSPAVSPPVSVAPEAASAPPAIAGQQPVADSERGCGHIAAWLAETDFIPPEVQSRRFGRAQPGGASAALQVPYESWLLQDAKFEPVFGKRYDAVTADEASRLRQTASRCPPPRNAQGQSVIDNMFVTRSFDDRYRARYIQGVVQIREAQLRGAAALSMFNTLQAVETAPQQFQEAAASQRQIEGFLDGKNRAEIRKAAKDAHNRAISPLQALRAQQAVANARGYEGLVALTSLQQGFDREAQMADVAPIPLPEMTAKLQTLVQDLVGSEKGRIDALGTGAVALERGVQWHQEYRSRYLPRVTSATSGLSAMLAYFEERRATALDAAEKDLTARVSQSRTDAELNQLVEKYIPLEFDQRHRSGTALLTSVAAKKDDLHKRAILGQPANAPAPASQTQADQRNVPSANSPPGATSSTTGDPSESDLFDAFNDRLEASNEQARGTAEKCNNRDFKNDPLLAMQCLQFGVGVGVTKGAQGVLPPQFKVSRFEKIGCEKAQGETGYRCDYVAGFAGNMNMPPSMGVLMKQGSISQSRFVRRGDRWLLLPDPRRDR